MGKTVFFFLPFFFERGTAHLLPHALRLQAAVVINPHVACVTLSYLNHALPCFLCKNVDVSKLEKISTWGLSERFGHSREGGKRRKTAWRTQHTAVFLQTSHSSPHASICFFCWMFLPKKNYRLSVPCVVQFAVPVVSFIVSFIYLISYHS